MDWNYYKEELTKRNGVLTAFRLWWIGTGSMELNVDKFYGLNSLSALMDWNKKSV